MKFEKLVKSIEESLGTSEVNTEEFQELVQALIIKARRMHSDISSIATLTHTLKLESLSSFLKDWANNRNDK